MRRRRERNIVFLKECFCVLCLFLVACCLLLVPFVFLTTSGFVFYCLLLVACIFSGGSNEQATSSAVCDVLSCVCVSVRVEQGV